MFTITLTGPQIDFLMNVLGTQPLPYNQTAPVISSIDQQVRQQMQPATVMPGPETAPAA